MTRFTYRDCKAYYRGLWDSMQIRAGREDDLKRLVKTMLSHKAAYEAVEKKTSVPWQVVGIIHCRESAFNFKTHLHNGDPLSKRTRHVPSGRPVNGTPPFTWEESAIDALRYDKLDLVGEWPVERICFELEKYNGSGYFKRNLPSPYLETSEQFTPKPSCKRGLLRLPLKPPPHPHYPDVSSPYSPSLPCFGRTSPFNLASTARLSSN